MSGRKILTATVRPSTVMALCTCAMDAAATGVSLNSLKSADTEILNSSSIILRATVVEKGGRLSRRSPRSLAISSPIKSERVDSACPSLMNAGPRRSSAAARRSPLRLPILRRLNNLPMAAARGEMFRSSKINTASSRARIKAIASRRRVFLRVRSIIVFGLNEWRPPLG